MTLMFPERWNIEEYYDPDYEKVDKSYCKWGGFVDNIDEFDASFFNISGKEAELTSRDWPGRLMAYPDNLASARRHLMRLLALFLLAFVGTPGMGGSQGVEVPPGPGRRDRSDPQGVGP